MCDLVSFYPSFCTTQVMISNDFDFLEAPQFARSKTEVKKTKTYATCSVIIHNHHIIPYYAEARQ